MKKNILISVALILVALSGCSYMKNNYIGEDKAKSIALSDAGLDADSVTFIRSSLDADDGKMLYDVEFYTKDYIEYDYEIDAQNGNIISNDKDVENYNPLAGVNQTTQTDSEIISEGEAKSIALQKVPGSTEENIRELRLETDDGIKVYEGKIIFDKKEYEFEINATTGEVISWESESVWD